MKALGPWGEIRHFAKQLLQGFVEADHFLAIYFAVDDEDKDEGTPADDDFDESKWIKANPLMEVNPLLMKEIRKEAVEAKSMPGRHAEFKIKRLNRPVGGSRRVGQPRQMEAPAPAPSTWNGCGNTPAGAAWTSRARRDLTSFRLVWNVDGVLYTHGWRFVPGCGGPWPHRAGAGAVSGVGPGRVS